MSIPLNSRLSVVSKNDIRYEGTLVAVDEAAAALTLAQVKAFGTEGRSPNNEIAPFPNLFPSIMFRGADIKELRIVPTASQVQQPQIAQPVAQPPQAAAAPQEPIARPSSSGPASQSRMTRLFSDNTKGVQSENLGAKSATPQPSASPTLPSIPKDATTSTITTSATTAEPEDKSKPTGAKKTSVFDDAPSAETAVVTVTGLTESTSVSDIKQLFKSHNIVSVKLVALPDGGTAADVVFSSKNEAERAVENFDHDGLSASLMSGATRRSNYSSHRGGRGGRGGSTAWRSRENGAGRGEEGYGRGRPRGGGTYRGGKEGYPFGRPHPKASAPEEPKGDFDFEAANAKFEREEFVPTEKESKPKSSFFDDDGMFQSLNKGSERSFRRSEERKKDAETFGAIAYTYRGSGYRGRGRGYYRGGRGQRFNRNEGAEGNTGTKETAT